MKNKLCVNCKHSQRKFKMLYYCKIYGTYHRKNHSCITYKGYDEPDKKVTYTISSIFPSIEAQDRFFEQAEKMKNGEDLNIENECVANKNNESDKIVVHIPRSIFPSKEVQDKAFKQIEEMNKKEDYK